MKNMMEKKTWKEFKECGLLWWINMILHTFGWAIVISYDENNEIIEVFPARVRYRGFSESINTKGYINISKYLNENSEELLSEAEEE